MFSRCLGNSVTVARLTLDQLVKVRILVPQFCVMAFFVRTYAIGAQRGTVFRQGFTVIHR